MQPKYFSRAKLSKYYTFISIGSVLPAANEAVCADGNKDFTDKEKNLHSTENGKA